MHDVSHCYGGQPSFLQQCVQELSILLHISYNTTYISDYTNSSFYDHATHWN